jgi:hypothetical protein
VIAKRKFHNNTRKVPLSKTTAVLVEKKHAPLPKNPSIVSYLKTLAIHIRV